MPRNPLAEVFGFPVDNMSQDAVDHRQGRLCPYGNPSGINCTKASATDPLGVCSIFDGVDLVVTCPVRLRQDRLILADAAGFFFPGKPYVALTEAHLKDANGKSAGNIDIVLCVLDAQKRVVDFGAIEVQAIYISGNVRTVFNEYMKDPATRHAISWPRKHYPVPDYLSSSRKRLVPQLVFKGGILHRWGKRMAVVAHRGFFAQLPHLEEVGHREAEMVWLLYDLRKDQGTNRYCLQRWGAKYTKFEAALDAIATPTVGRVEEFTEYLEGRIKARKISGTPQPSSLEPTVEPLRESVQPYSLETTGHDRDE